MYVPNNRTSKYKVSQKCIYTLTTDPDYIFKMKCCLNSYLKCVYFEEGTCCTWGKSLIEMQGEMDKTTMRCYRTTRMAKITLKIITSCEYAYQLESSTFIDVRAKWKCHVSIATWKMPLAISYIKWSIQLSCHPIILFLGIYPRIKTYVHTKICTQKLTLFKIVKTGITHIHSSIME